MSMTTKVLADLGRSAPDVRITEAKILGYLTDACHEIQSATGAVVCNCKIFLDETDTGEYRLGSRPKAIKRIEQSVNDAFPLDHKPVNVMIVDQFNRMIFDNTFSPSPVPQPANQIFAAIEGCKLRLWPYATAGFIFLDYVPHLLPYSPDDTDDWAGYGTNPASAMKANGLPEALIPALEGIIAYAKVKLVESFPNEMTAYQNKIAGWEKQFKHGINLVRRNNVDYQRSTALPTKMGFTF